MTTKSDIPTNNDLTPNESTNNATTNQQITSITLEKLSKRFNREWIFKDMDYSFSPGKIYAVTGPNGSGKSTLLQVLWGQMPPTSGNILYKRSNETIPIEEVYQYLTIATPYMDLIDEFTLMEQITFHFKLKKIKAGLSPEDLLSIINLEPARDKYIANFSSGMKQRLKLGLAFYTQADVLFLDEPGTNLDQNTFAWYLEQLGKVSGDRLIFIASNNPEEYPENATMLNILDYKV